MKKTVNIFQKCIVGVVLLCTAAILAIMIWKQPVRFQSSKTYRCIPIVLTGFLFLGVMPVFRWIDTCSKRSLARAYAFFAFIILAIYVVLWVNLSSIQTNDAARLMDQAIAFAREGAGPEHVLERYQSYFGCFSNNYFFTILFSCFYRLLFGLGIENVLLPSYFLGFLAVSVSILFTVLTAVRLRGDRCGAKVLLLCALNPTVYLYTLWVYTTVFSLPFMMGTVYFGIRMYQARTKKEMIVYAVCEGAAAVLGYYIRATVLIPVIALGVCALLLFMRGALHGRGKHLAFGAAAFFLTSVFLFQAVGGLNRMFFGDTEDQNYPIVHWIAMGTRGNGTVDHSAESYISSFETKEEKQKAALEIIKNNMEQLGVKGLCRLFLEKLKITWSDGYHSVDVRLNQAEKFTWLYRYLAGDKKDLFVLYSYAWHMFVYLLLISSCAVYLFSKRDNYYTFLMLLVFLGGILFYSFWEAKNAYSVPFLWYLVLAAEPGGSCLSVLPGKIKMKKSVYYCCGLLSGVYILGMAVLCARWYPFLTTCEISRRVYTINCGAPKNMAFTNQNSVLRQSFRANGTPIDHIVFYIRQNAGYKDTPKKRNKNGYLVQLADAEGNVLREAFVGKGNITEGTAYAGISFDEVRPENGEELYIQIRRQGKGKAPFIFGYKQREIEVYRGDCSVNDELQDYDIWMQAYQGGEQTFFSRRTAILFLAGFWLTSVVLLAVFIKSQGFLTGPEEFEERRGL